MLVGQARLQNDLSQLVGFVPLLEGDFDGHLLRGLAVGGSKDPPEAALAQRVLSLGVEQVLANLVGEACTVHLRY